MAESEVETNEATPLFAYKTILQNVIDTRPSGTRQRLAEAMGKNRSFVSQITSPSYVTPVPVQHLETIFHICHFSPTERLRFLEAYRAAHPGRLDVADGANALRTLTIELPDFGTAALNRKADEMIHAVVRGLNELIQSPLLNPDNEPAKASK